jgi:hypothetical protein
MTASVVASVSHKILTKGGLSLILCIVCEKICSWFYSNDSDYLCKKKKKIKMKYVKSTYIAHHSPTCINPLKPSGNYMYHLLYKSVIVRSVFMGFI